MNENYNTPAFPPQWAMDSLQRVVAPITGVTKLEYTAIQLLPHFLSIARHSTTEQFDAYKSAVDAAKFLLDTINNKDQNSTLTMI
jgi:hypothetical protein